MQFRVRFAQAPAIQESGFLLWVLSCQSLDLILSDWPHRVSWDARVPQTFAYCRRCEYHPTALARSRPAGPISAFLAAARPPKRQGRLLYHGVGRDLPGARALGQRGHVSLFDPYHPSGAVRTWPLGVFEEVHSVYVLCVLDPNTGRRVIGEIRSLLSPSGFAAISVRR